MSNKENLPYDEREEDYREFDEYDEVAKPATSPFYKRRKYWIFCAILTVIIVAIVVPVALFAILPKVAQNIINKSNMGFKSIQITNPTNTSMTMSMNGDLTDTGPFSATIKFPEPIEVYYGETKLGSMSLPDAKASGGHGDLIADATFNIADETAFGSFSADMVSPYFSFHSYPSYFQCLMLHSLSTIPYPLNPPHLLLSYLLPSACLQPRYHSIFLVRVLSSILPLSNPFFVHNPYPTIHGSHLPISD